MNNLLVKSIFGLAFLILCLALALFIPAGSLAYWQAWVYLGVWTLSFIGGFVVSGLDFRFIWSSVPPLVSLISDGFVALGFHFYEAYRLKVRYRLMPYIW